MYSPLANLYQQHKRHINDFPVIIAIYLAAYSVDATAYHGFGINLPTVTLPVFGLLYGSVYYVVKTTEKKDYFSVFSHNLVYSLFFGFMTYIFYIIYFRAQKLPDSGLWGIL